MSEYRDEHDYAESSLDADQRAELYRRLYEATAALSAAATPAEVVAVMFAHGLELLQADAGFIGVISDDGRDLAVQRFADYSGDAREQLSLPIDASYPIAVSSRDGKPRFIQNNDELTCDFPGLVRLNADDHSCATVPLVSDDQLWGALNVAFDTPRPFTDAERALILALGRHCGVAYQRAIRLQVAEARARNAQALEIHDDVVQDLAVARLALEAGLLDEAKASLTSGLEAAKRIVTEVATDVRRYERLRD